MATSSKLLNLRKPAALHNLIRRHLVSPSAAKAPSTQSAAAVVPDAQHLSPFLLNSSNVNPHASNFPINWQWPLLGFGHSVVRIEAARTYVPKASKDDVHEDFDDEDDDDDDDDDDDGDVVSYDESDFDDEGEVVDENMYDDDPDPNLRRRRYRE